MAVAFSSDQMGIIRASALALALAAIGLSAGYAWLPPSLFALEPAMDFGERIEFTLKVDILMFIWLAGCVGAVNCIALYRRMDTSA